MKRAIVLFRKSEFYPKPVLCGVWEYEEHELRAAEDRIAQWKNEFLSKLPEFKNAEFTADYTDIF